MEEGDLNYTHNEDIATGNATDQYFVRTEEALKHANENPNVVADITADQFKNNEWEVLAGVQNAMKTLAATSDKIKVWALPEGSLFDGGPVLRIKGPYQEFLRVETSILGFLSHASGIATNAYKAVQSGNQYPQLSVLSFGARHVNPKIAPMIERSALIGGVDGFSHTAAGELLDKEASGTMPHAIVLAMDSQEKAWQAFNEAAPEDVPRIVIADTFTDEVDEALRAANTLGQDLDGVRLDTTGSRRGKFKHIIKEVRWELDAIGRNDVDIFISGGLGPDDIDELGPYVDGVGVGSYISNADPVDFGLDIVVRNGNDTTKRGKLPGMKHVAYKNGGQVIKPADQPDSGRFELAVENGDVLIDYSVDRAHETLQNAKTAVNEVVTP